jgi:hypothetical protein
MWAHLQRQGVPVARCTVERLMREHGWRGATRTKKVRTTVADPHAVRAPDLVRRCFTAARPDALWVADFTYTPMTEGRFGYTAFVIDAFAGLIPGWECSMTKHTDFVQAAIRQAAARRRREGHPLRGTVHHSDAGSQYTSVHFGQTLYLEGLTPSVRHRRGRARQRPRRDHDRPVQDRVRSRRVTVPPRPTGDPGRPRGDHLGLGALVQHPAAHAPPRPNPTRRGRSDLLRYNRHGHPGRTQELRCARNPGRFKLLVHIGGGWGVGHEGQLLLPCGGPWIRTRAWPSPAFACVGDLWVGDRRSPGPPGAGSVVCGWPGRGLVGG